MTRCDYDIIFYRVFCITLLAIAFTFTVILTNVFVDIDGLLSNEEKAKSHELASELEATVGQTAEDPSPDHANYEVVYNIDKQLEYEGENVLERKKRSSETKSPKYKIKNQKLKQLLTRQLATLLEEIDAEAEEITIKPTKYDTTLIPDNLDEVEKKYLIEESNKRETDEGLLFAAMHHLLLNGITSHMDLHKMNKAIHDLSTNMRSKSDKMDEDELSYIFEPTDKPTTESIQSSNEIKFISNEFANYDGLQKEVTMVDSDSDTVKKANKSMPATNIIINTLIDIKKDENNMNKTGKENIKGIIKLIYNGKVIEVSNPDEEKEQNNSTTPKLRLITPVSAKAKPHLITENVQSKNTPEYYFKKALADYANKYYKSSINNIPIMNNLLNKSRLKRQISSDMKEIMAKHKDKNNSKSRQDELFVEIETHIDNKDLKNEPRKHRIIKNLIDKIQQAIYSNIGNLRTKEKKKRRLIQIKKRLMTSMDDKIVNKISMEPIIHRQLDPISKVLNKNDMDSKLSTLADSNTKHQPRFLSNTKTINSAENGNVQVAYEKSFPEISQRLQIPLYNDDDDTYSLDNLKFSVKSIDGAGLAFGFNQYIDTAPDAEKFIIFDKLEKMMESLPDSVDEINDTKNSTVTDSLNKQLLKTMVSLHNIAKRDIYLQELKPNQIKYPENTMEFDYGVGLKDLLSLEQNDEKLTNGFGLDAFDRKKRYTPQVQQISSIKNKVKLNKYLNTDIMASKSVLWKKKRHRRDMDNIFLSDLTNPTLVYPENINDTPYEENEDKSFRLYDERQAREKEPFVNKNGEDTFSVISEPSLGYVLNDNVEQTPLMSRYPHIIMGGFDKSKEYDLKTKVSINPAPKNELPPVRAHLPFQTDDNIPFEELVNAIAPDTSYKVTVKLAPRNQSQLNVETRKMGTKSNDTDKNVEEEKNEEIEESTKKIEHELESLLQQKETLETIFNAKQRENKGKDLIELLLPFNPPKILHLNKEDVGKLIKTALIKLKDLSPSADYKSSIAVTTSTPTTKSALKTNTELDSGITKHDLKAITNEILNKIESNSNNFQMFLKKLSEKLDQPQKQEETERNIIFRRVVTANNSNNNNEASQIKKEVKEFVPNFINQGHIMLPSIPPFEVNKNGTYIPFIYAYQHALPSFNGSKSSDHLANVVYHGHIHANTIPNKKRSQQENIFFKDKKAMNHSRYFLDELERGRPPIKLFKLMKKPGINK